MERMPFPSELQLYVDNNPSYVHSCVARGILDTKEHVYEAISTYAKRNCVSARYACDVRASVLAYIHTSVIGIYDPSKPFDMQTYVQANLSPP